ncbi:MAG: outer membrane beta-barrel protein, partial [Bacteroidota bacterium]
SNYSHRIGFELRQKLDTLARLRVEGSATIVGGENRDIAETLIRNEAQTVDDYTVNQFTQTERPSGDISIRYNRGGGGGRRSFMGGGQTANRTFGINAGASYNKNQTDLDVLTEGLNEGTALPGALVNGQQVQDRRTDSYNFEVGVDYAEPIGKSWRLRFDGDADLDRDEGNFNFRLGEDRTANLLDRDWLSLGAAASMIYTFGKGSNLSFGTRYQANTLTLDGDVMKEDNFNFLLPFVRLRMRMKKGFFSANLNSSSRAPSIGQLQTIAQPNTSGRVSIGNPDLEPAVNTRFNSFMWFNDQFRAISANFNVNLTYTDNAFGNSVTFTEGQQIYQTINVGHAWSGGLFASSTIGMNFINGELRLKGNVNGSRGVGFVDEVSQVNTSISTSAGISVTTELNEDSYILVGYDLSRFVNSFEGDGSPTTGQTTHDLLGQFELEVSPKWRFESRFLYSIFAANDFAAAQNIPDLRVSLELRPFRKKGHFIRFSASDLFNQNTIVRRSVQPFVTTETTADGLGRYYLATFHYKI